MADRSSLQSEEYPFLYAHTFLVCWEGADKRFHDELDGLGRTFREDLNFTTHLFKIPDKDPLSALTRALLAFLDNDEPETLLVLYYGGHGSSNSDNDLIWRLDSSGDPSVNWTCLQQHIFGKQSDVLLILDCCSAASAIRERQRGRVESLMGCGIEDKTPIDGEYCFTRRISKKLRDHSAKYGITAYDIYHELHQEYNKTGPDRKGKGKDPVYARPGKQLERTIWLRRMESFSTAKSKTRFRHLAGPRTDRTIEVINTIEYSDMGEPGGNSTRSVISLQTTRSTATIYHSILNETRGANWTTEKETVLLENLEGLHLVDVAGDNEDDAHSGITYSGGGPIPSERIELPSSATKSLSPLMDFNRTVIEDALNTTPIFTSTLLTRARGELRDLATDLQMNNAPDYFTLSPISASDILEWQATIKGPTDTPYEAGIFHLFISLTDRKYPLQPPRVWFNTRIYHPNIDEKGAICADFLGPGWSAANTLQVTVLMVLVLLQTESLEDPLVPEIADQKRNDPAGFERTAREWTRLYATGSLQM